MRVNCFRNLVPFILFGQNNLYNILLSGACKRCLNGGKCIGANQCQSADGFSGEWCQYSKHTFQSLFHIPTENITFVMD